MLRVLDLDLDFFIDGAAHWSDRDSGRLDAADFPPWPAENALSFLEDACKLTGKLPGFVVEHHAEVFQCWRDAIAAGRLQPPFAVTHADGHADLGLGDIGYEYLMTELLFLPPEKRQFPKTGPGGVDDGNWLAFAIACRWIAELVYVLNTSGPPGDLFPYYMDVYVSGADREPGFTGRANSIQLAAVEAEQLDNVRNPPGDGPLKTERLEPKVPFSWVEATEFAASEPYDVICLARSPAFTPAELDELFGAIREQFIDETVF